MISLKTGFVKRIIRTNKFIIIIMVLLLGSSCNQSLRFASVKYDGAAIKHLLDSTNMEYLTFQVKAPEAKNYKKAFTLVSYARTATGGFVDTVAYDLQPQEGIKTKTFKGKITLGTLTLDRTELKVLFPSGGSMNPDFLLFTPLRNASYGYLYFDISKGPTGSISDSSSEKIVLRPCPPAVNCHGRLL